MTLLHQAAQKAVEAALRRAFHLGQIYWQQADSESRAQNRQAETTQSKFDALAAETLSALQQQPEPVAVWQSKCKDGTWVDCDEANAQAGESYGFPCRVLYTAPPALQERRRTEYTPGGLAVTVVDDAPALQQQEVPREPVATLDIVPMAEPRITLLPARSRLSLGSYLLYAASPSTTQQQEAGNGWKLVPETITEEMHVAAIRTAMRCSGNDDFPRRVWRAMLAAAPSTPESAEKDDAGGGEETVKCPECDGEGEFESALHCEKCGKCAGAGKLPVCPESGKHCNWSGGECQTCGATAGMGMPDGAKHG